MRYQKPRSADDFRVRNVTLLAGLVSSSNFRQPGPSHVVKRREILGFSATISRSPYRKFLDPKSRDAHPFEAAQRRLFGEIFAWRKGIALYMRGRRQTSASEACDGAGCRAHNNKLMLLSAVMNRSKDIFLFLLLIILFPLVPGVAALLGSPRQ